MVSINTHLPEHRVELADIQHWLGLVVKQYPDDEAHKLQQAVWLVWDKLGNQTDVYGEQHMHYVLSACEILLSIQSDADTLLATVLQGVVEVHELDNEHLAATYGTDVVDMIRDLDLVAKITSDGTMMGIEDSSAENLRRLLLGIADDVRVILIVLARRTHRMRRLKWQDEALRWAFANITLEIHAPLANRLGIWQIKWELEDLALRYVRPEEYRNIASLLASKREQREGYIQEVIELLQQQFKVLNINAEITGRPKHIFSIWKKMRRKKLAFDQIFDVLAVRVIVDTIPQCYAALGIVHGQWNHIPGEFDDYIATPKGNNYQSLHTAVVGPGNKPLEIQVRTHEMHQHAEFGVAAHWRYKEGGEQNAELERRILWMRQWLEQKSIALDESTDDAIDDDIDDSNIYVLTPVGKVVELPRGATPVDFAYAIHTSVGHRCRGAKVDGKMVPLTRALENAQTVEILTGNKEHPSRDWLNAHSGYITTSRARNRIRQWIKQQDYDQHLAAGKHSIEREIHRLALAKPDFPKIVERYNLNTVDDLFAAVGRGDLTALQVIGGSPSQAKRKKTRRKVHTKQGASDVVVEGVADLMTSLAKCCKPVHGDDIGGYITKGKGVSVHRIDCHVLKNLQKTSPERLVDVHWSDEYEEQYYRVDVQVIANDRKGLLRDLSNVFTSAEVDVVGLNSFSDRKQDTASMRFTIEIQDMTQLGRVIDKVSHDPDVINVFRRTE